MEKCYNEKYYLNQSDIYNELLIKSKNNIIDKNEEENKYKELINKYKEFIIKSSKLIETSSSTDNVLKVFIIIDLLIEKGVFSINDIHKYNCDISNELKFYPGINIVSGEGCCRNVTYFVRDLVNKLNKYNKLYCCFSTSLKPISYANIHKANHILNLFYYDNVLYGYDVTNGCLCSFINERQLKIIYNYLDHYFTYKPYYEVINDGVSIDEIENNMNNFRDSSKKRAISYYEFIDYKNEVMDSINNTCINDFKEETKVLKKEINSLLQS